MVPLDPVGMPLMCPAKRFGDALHHGRIWALEWPMLW